MHCWRVICWLAACLVASACLQSVHAVILLVWRDDYDTVKRPTYGLVTSSGFVINVYLNFNDLVTSCTGPGHPETGGKQPYYTSLRCCGQNVAKDFGLCSSYPVIAVCDGHNVTDSILTLFLRVRLHHWCKLTNESLKIDRLRKVEKV